MRGSSHQKIAMLSYAVVATIPIVNQLAIFNNRYIHVQMGISIIGIGVAGLAGLLVDADSKHSTINHMNPLIEGSSKAISQVEKLLKLLLRLILGLGLCALTLWYSKTIIANLETVKYIGQYAQVCTYFLAFILIVTTVTNERYFKKIPVIGMIYKTLSAKLSKGSNDASRVIMFLTYIGLSVILAIYNISNLNDISIYVICVLLIGIAIFPHRSLLHSVEGVIIFTISAAYVFNKLGYEYLTGCFFIGYVSHIYLGDIFTKEGVPVLTTPRFIGVLLKKLEIHNVIVTILEKIGEFKLKLPPHITTGSDIGNLVEIIYIIVLFIVMIIGFNIYGLKIRII